MTAAFQLVESDAANPEEACQNDPGYVQGDGNVGLVSWRALAPLTAPISRDSDPAAFEALTRDEAGGIVSFPTITDAEAFIDTELYQTLRRVLTSLQIAPPG